MGYVHQFTTIKKVVVYLSLSTTEMRPGLMPLSTKCDLRHAVTWKGPRPPAVILSTTLTHSGALDALWSVTPSTAVSERNSATRRNEGSLVSEATQPLPGVQAPPLKVTICGYLHRRYSRFLPSSTPPSHLPEPHTYRQSASNGKNPKMGANHQALGASFL